MEILCILTLGIECGGAFNNTDSDHHFRNNEPAPHVGAAPVPEPGAALLFGVGLATLAACNNKGRDRA